MSPQVSVLLSCLIIGFGLCYGTSIEKLRIARDTRNIPSNMFKPLNNGLNENQNTTAIVPDNNSESTFSEHSTGEARADRIPQVNRQFYPQQISDEEDYEDRLPYPPVTPRFRQPNRFVGQSRNPFPTGIRNTNFESSFYNSNRESSAGFGNPGFSDPDFGSIRPIGSQTIPLMSTGIGPSFSSSGFPDSSLGRGSSSNFFRSESYSYTSDGNGPPQVERNVFDSRLGHPLSSRNF